MGLGDSFFLIKIIKNLLNKDKKDPNATDTIQAANSPAQTANSPAQTPGTNPTNSPADTAAIQTPQAPPGGTTPTIPGATSVTAPGVTTPVSNPVPAEINFDDIYPKILEKIKLEFKDAGGSPLGNDQVKQFDQKITQLNTAFAQRDKTIDEFKAKVEMITEKAEKFDVMLYEITTNKFNPFIKHKENVDNIPETPQMTKEEKIMESQIEDLAIHDVINDKVQSVNLASNHALNETQFIQQAGDLPKGVSNQIPEPTQDEPLQAQPQQVQQPQQAQTQAPQQSNMQNGHPQFQQPFIQQAQAQQPSNQQYQPDDGQGQMLQPPMQQAQAQQSKVGDIMSQQPLYGPNDPINVQDQFAHEDLNSNKGHNINHYTQSFNHDDQSNYGTYNNPHIEKHVRAKPRQISERIILEDTLDLPSKGSNEIHETIRVEEQWNDPNYKDHMDELKPKLERGDIKDMLSKFMKKHEHPETVNPPESHEDHKFRDGIMNKIKELELKLNPLKHSPKKTEKVDTKAHVTSHSNTHQTKSKTHNTSDHINHHQAHDAKPLAKSDSVKHHSSHDANPISVEYSANHNKIHETIKHPTTDKAVKHHSSHDANPISVEYLAKHNESHETITPENSVETPKTNIIENPYSNVNNNTLNTNPEINKGEIISEVPQPDIDINLQTTDEQRFYFQNGNSAASIKEMINTIKISPNSLFSFHVNEEKNDFASWVQNVFNNKKLSDKISRSTTRQEFLQLFD